MQLTILHVTARWDGDSRTWVAVSEDIPGLVTGAPSREALSTKLQHLVPACFSASGRTLPKEYDIDITYENAEGRA
jgi:hypothetical protein